MDYAWNVLRISVEKPILIEMTYSSRRIDIQSTPTTEPTAPGTGPGVLVPVRYLADHNHCLNVSIPCQNHPYRRIPVRKAFERYETESRSCVVGERRSRHCVS